MHMVVAIHMVEGKAGTPKSPKLSPYFLFQLLPHSRPKEKFQSGAEEMGGKPPSWVHQIRYGLGRRYRRSVDQHQMEPDPQRGDPPGSVYGISGRPCPNHQTGCGKDPPTMGFFDRFIHRQGESEVIAGYDNFFH